MTNTSLKFDTDFESANGEKFETIGESRFAFSIRADTGSDDRQWFYFRVRGGTGRELTAELRNAGATNIPGFWFLARPVVSHDSGKTWSHTALGKYDFESGTFAFSFRAESDATLIAMHFPYTHADVSARIDQWAKHPHAERDILGKSVEGRSIERLVISDLTAPRAGKRGIWLSARQHAAETGGSFAFEGLIDFLLSNDPAAEALRKHAEIHVVPMINPDGVAHGNYRDNARGVNLNRVWNNPDSTDSPEVLCVTEAIREWTREMPFDFFIDFHSDSCTYSHYAFHASATMTIDGDDGEYYRKTVRFLALAGAECADFLPGKGITGSRNTGISYHFMRETYGALSFIPEAGYGCISHGENAGAWLDPDRHRAVGRAFGIALAHYYDLIA